MWGFHIVDVVYADQCLMVVSTILERNPELEYHDVLDLDEVNLNYFCFLPNLKIINFLNRC